MQNRAVHLLENAGKVLESLTEPSVTALASTSHVETRVHAPRRTPRRTTPGFPRGRESRCAHSVLTVRTLNATAHAVARSGFPPSRERHRG